MKEGGSTRPGVDDASRNLGQQPPAVDAATLLGGHREIMILHNGERYRLRLTQNGKLILTK